MLWQIHRFHPDIIHYIHGPTIRSFLVTKALATISPMSATVMSAPRPQLSKWAERLVPLLKPDALLVQSKKESERFSRLGCRVSFLPGGVSLDQFQPSDQQNKVTLRRRHGLHEIRFLVLHVGQITSDRGVSLLADLKRALGDQADFLIVGARTIPPEPELVRQLQESGCLLHLDYAQHIEEFYQMADCYIFPGLGQSPAIEIPLSVLEAMACNLPVLTSPFGGLPDLYTEGDGFAFAASPGEFQAKLRAWLACPPPEVHTRQKVAVLSWEAIADRLSAHYQEVLDTR